MTLGPWITTSPLAPTVRSWPCASITPMRTPTPRPTEPETREAGGRGVEARWAGRCGQRVRGDLGRRLGHAVGLEARYPVGLLQPEQGRLVELGAGRADEAQR